MEFLFYVFFIAFVVYFIKNKFQYEKYDEGGDTQVEIKHQEVSSSLPDVDVSMYRKRYTLMNNSESSFFHLMRKHLPDGYHIFPKMRIADIIETKDGKGYYKQRNKILPKHVDFIVCNSSLRPVCAIEIDGKSHDTPEMRDRDVLIEYIFKSVDIPLERVRVGTKFEDVAIQISEVLRR